ncbi:hypothetical protein ACOSP7_022687 [Xanthoceras sorbifolium]
MQAQNWLHFLTVRYLQKKRLIPNSKGSLKFTDFGIQPQNQPRLDTKSSLPRDLSVTIRLNRSTVSNPPYIPTVDQLTIP